MNMGRVAAAAVVAWVVSIGIGYLVNEVLFAGMFAANAAAFRPQAEMMANLPIGFGVMLLGFFAFAYMYAKGYEGGAGVMEGIRFGLLVGIMLDGFAMVWYWVTIPIDASLGIAMMLDGLVEFTIYGGIVGAIYRPVGMVAPRRTVGA
jgi:hypothetical protein